ncbi:hypothetical protein [Arthrobacter sp. B1I2]
MNSRGRIQAEVLEQFEAAH